MMDHLHGSTAISGVSLYDANAFPVEYRNQIYSGNVMTSRINRDRLERHGATMIATEIEDFLTSDDPWFRPVDIQLGPDGSLYVADFYNRIIGHYEVPLEHPGRDRDSGRIWRIRHQDTPLTSLRVGNQQFPLESLLGELTHGNISRRQLSLDALTDIALNNESSRESLVTVAVNRLRSDHEFSQVGALWFLHRLQRLRTEHLIPILQDSPTLVRTHALRAVFESSSTNEQNIDPLLLGEIRRALDDESAEVRSWAAMALSRLGTPADAKLLVSSIANHSTDDRMLRARLRIALRDLIARHPVALEELKDKSLPMSERQIYREILLGIHSSEVVQPLIEDLPRAESLRESLPWIRHAVKCADEAQLTKLIETLQTRSSDHERQSDISPHELFKELQQVTTGRSVPALDAWVERFVMDSLDAVQQAVNEDQLPIAWTAESGPAWAFENRQANDHSSDTRYRSSFTRGETYTGTMLSGEFSARDSLSFWLVGHNGFPANDAPQLNRVRLLDAGSGEVLREAFPPRSDIANQVTWDLTAWRGNRVRLEVIDGDAGTAYAWIAVGRFDHPGLNASAFEDKWKSTLSLVKDYKIKSAIPRLESVIASPTINRASRLQALQCKAELSGNAIAAQAATMVLSYGEDVKLQDRCLEIAGGESEPMKAVAAYREIVRALALARPRRDQLEIARQLAANRELTPWLIEAWEEGWLTPELAHDKSVETALESSISDDLRDRLQTIKQSVSPVNEAANALAQELLHSAAEKVGDLKQGEAIFQKHCAVCHQLAGTGSLVGPQLDGVGARSRERLLEDILFPDRNVDKAFRTTSLLLADGSVRVGLIRAESPDSIELVDNAGKVIRVNADDIDSRRVGGRSLMPDGHHETLGMSGMLDLLTFLQAKAAQPIEPGAGE
jgi:putative heme-binding domain-containing protein